MSRASNNCIKLADVPCHGPGSHEPRRRGQVGRPVPRQATPQLMRTRYMDRRSTLRHMSLAVVVSLVWVTLPFSQESSEEIATRLVKAAIERTSHEVTYDGSYRRIDYPGGDVPDGIGVCTDVVIRTYRGVGIDLQEAVHEDMSAAFSAYPTLWGLERPDSNIDLRRVPNLQVFFRRNGTALPVSENPEDFRAGEIVTWMLPGNLPHIGIVTDHRSSDGVRPLVVHNIGSGPKLEDRLFEFPITGHYKYDGPK